MKRKELTIETFISEILFFTIMIVFKLVIGKISILVNYTF